MHGKNIRHIYNTLRKVTTIELTVIALTKMNVEINR